MLMFTHFELWEVKAVPKTAYCSSIRPALKIIFVNVPTTENLNKTCIASFILKVISRA